MNKSIFGITLMVILSYGQMSWADEACISGLKTIESSNQVAIFFPRHVTASKTKASVNGTDITEEFCELTTLIDGIQEIRCKIRFSQHPIAHIAGSPHDLFDVRVRIDASQQPSQLTAGCTHRSQDLRDIILGSSRAAVGVDEYGNFGGTPNAQVSCTPSGITTIVACPPPLSVRGWGILGYSADGALVEFNVPFKDPQM